MEGDVSDPEEPRKRGNPFEGFRVEVDGARLEELADQLRAAAQAAQKQVTGGLEQARHVKVRFAYQGRPLGPDLPLAAFLAGQGVLLGVLGPLWTLVGNLGARAVLEVRFVHAADEKVDEGVELWVRGEAEAAEAAYREALRMRPGHVPASYHLGVLLRVTGRLDEAKARLRDAVMSDGDHPDAARAAELLARLEGGRRL
jgi:tetratricopeptide (TPR) repeat protein